MKFRDKKYDVFNLFDKQWALATAGTLEDFDGCTCEHRQEKGHDPHRGAAQFYGLRRQKSDYPGPGGRRAAGGEAG